MHSHARASLFIHVHPVTLSHTLHFPNKKQTKQIVKSRITQGLTDPNPRLRVAVAYVIAKIAHCDWPETWPRLFDELLGLLKSGIENNVHGALRVLTEFIRDDMTDEQFPYIAPTLLPELYAVFCRDEVFVSMHYLLMNETFSLLSNSDIFKHSPCQMSWDL